MAEAIDINTGKYKKDGRVVIDGKAWTIKLPGAGTDLKMNQAQRRLRVLDKKIESDTATEEDLDKYDKYEAVVFEAFKGMLSDGTEENSEVNSWLDDTPLAIIIQVFEDIKEQANGRENKATSA